MIPDEISPDELYQFLSSFSPYPFAVICDEVIVYIDSRAVELLGASAPNELINKSIWNFLHPEDWEIAKQRMMLIQQNVNPPGIFHPRLLRKDGKIIRVEVKTLPITFKNTKAFIVAGSIPYCASPPLKKALTHQELYPISLFEHHMDMVCTLNLHGEILGVNPATEKITGYQAKDMLNCSFISFVAEVHKQQTTNHIYLAAIGDIQEFELTLVSNLGNRIDLLLKLIPIRIHKRINGIYAIAKNMTELHHAEELLRRSDKLSIVGQFAAGIAHEIRNPLTSLKGFLQLLYPESEHHKRRYFDIMLSELERINVILNELLWLARPQPGAFELKDVRLLLNQVVSLLESQANLEDVQLELELDNIPLICCDENQIKQVFINVIKNAIEASPNGAVVSIKVMEPIKNQVSVQIQDLGPGIPEEYISRLGEPFFTTKENGTGLGYMVSQKIMENHGGKINISCRQSQGTMVEVIIPSTNSYT